MAVTTNRRILWLLKNQKKGVAGKNTGAKTRKAIKDAQKKGCTLAEIGRAANRDPSVISDIKRGEIKNPPSNVATAIQKGCKKESSKKK